MDPRGTDATQFLDQNNELSVENPTRLSSTNVSAKCDELEIALVFAGGPGRYDSQVNT